MATTKEVADRLLARLPKYGDLPLALAHRLPGGGLAAFEAAPEYVLIVPSGDETPVNKDWPNGAIILVGKDVGKEDINAYLSKTDLILPPGHRWV